MARPLTVRRASVREVLLAVQARLASWLGWNAGRILVEARETAAVPRFTGDQDVLLRYRGFVADWQRHRDRHDCRVTNRVVAVLRSRLESDEADRDDRWLTDATAGAVAGWDQIVDALQVWFPTDAAGNHLTIEGLFVMQGDVPGKSRKDQGWGEVELVFGAVTELPLTQSAAF